MFALLATIVDADLDKAGVFFLLALLLSIVSALVIGITKRSIEWILLFATLAFGYAGLLYLT